MILLTGATGFVGRNLLLRLLSEGREVTAAVRSPEKLRNQLAGEGFGSLPRNLRICAPDPASWSGLAPTEAVLGAGVLFARSREEYWETNVTWTLEVLRMLPADCRTVLISSQAAGGPTAPGRSLRTANDPDTPITWYGASKLAMERAVREAFADRLVSILRPPMILGARDTATLPLFRMARGLVRIKPGFAAKSYSFVAVDDLVAAVLAALRCAAGPGPEYVAAPDPVTDWDLIALAAAVSGARGVTLPVPEAGVRALSLLVDTVPALRRSAPSLTRDRARDIWETRWVVDGEAFSRRTGWSARTGVRAALEAAFRHYRKEALL